MHTGWHIPAAHVVADVTPGSTMAQSCRHDPQLCGSGFKRGARRTAAQITCPDGVNCCSANARYTLPAVPPSGSAHGVKRARSTVISTSEVRSTQFATGVAVL